MYETANLMSLRKAAQHLSVAAGVLALCTALWVLWHQFPGILTDISRNYNEGWMTTFAQRLLNGDSLYPDRSSLIANSYPPLWFIILAVLEFLGFDANTAGRAIALSSIAGSALGVWLVCKALGSRPKSAFIAASFSVGALAGWLPQYVAMNDPHMFAQAMMLIGASIALSHQDSSRALLIAVALVALAGFTKHSLLAIPLSLGLYFLAERPRSFWIYALSLGAIVVSGLATLSIIYGSNFWAGLSSPRELSIRSVQWYVYDHWFLYCAALVLGSIGLTRWRSDRSLTWPLLYLLLSLSFGCFFMLSDGVSGNHFFDAIVAIAITWGVIDKEADAPNSPKVKLLASSALLFLLLMIALRGIPESAALYTAQSVREFEARVAVDRIREYRGAVACEDAMLCVRAGKLSALDFYAVGQKLKLGAFKTPELIATIKANDVEAIQFRGAAGSSNRLPADAVDALLSRFSVREFPAMEHFSIYQLPAVSDTREEP